MSSREFFDFKMSMRLKCFWKILLILQSHLLLIMIWYVHSRVIIFFQSFIIMKACKLLIKIVANIIFPFLLQGGFDGFIFCMYRAVIKLWIILERFLILSHCRPLLWMMILELRPSSLILTIKVCKIMSFHWLILLFFVLNRGALQNPDAWIVGLQLLRLSEIVDYWILRSFWDWKTHNNFMDSIDIL